MELVQKVRRGEALRACRHAALFARFRKDQEQDRRSLEVCRSAPAQRSSADHVSTCFRGHVSTPRECTLAMWFRNDRDLGRVHATDVSRALEPRGSLKMADGECRICFDLGEEPLIWPCPCRGSPAGVHFSCLRESRTAVSNRVLDFAWGTLLAASDRSGRMADPCAFSI